jgi:class 3 adenylate cyclase
MSDPPGAAGTTPAVGPADAAVLEHLVRADLSRFWETWREQGPRLIEREPVAGGRIGRALLDIDEPLLACDVLSQSIERWPGDVPLRQLLGLSLAQAGAIEQASNVASELRTEGHEDEETEGLAARILKDRALATVDPTDRRRRLEMACDAYERSFARHHGYWSGINAATLALLAERRDKARGLAKETKDQCLGLVTRAELNLYWPLATLGEACLVLGEREDAASWYARAAAAGRDRLRDLASTRRNGRLLSEALAIEPTWLDACLPMPTVVVFSGHMIDRPGRPTPRFPQALEPAVSEGIRQKLGGLHAVIAYGSAACGADILFLEAVAALGGEIRLVLPYQPERFEEDSVAFAGEGWRQRFRTLKDRAASVLVASEQARIDDPLVYRYANRILLGLALDRAARLETTLVPLAVWDGQPGDGDGGTASNIQLWRSRGLRPEFVRLGAGAQGAVPQWAEPPAPRGTKRRLVALLRADGRGLGQLSDDRFPDFVKRFLGGAAQALQAAGVSPLFKNTWGDGIDLVFSTVVEAGIVALEIADRLASSALLKEMPAIRIALHVGPVHELHDPVTDRPGYFGSHITRVARIEPITPSGQVWASEAFAALTRLEDQPPFGCEYVGRLPLDKGFGVHPLYRLRRRG